MKIAIHQSHYLPWLGYFYKIQNVDTFVILDDVQFQRRGFQSRNKIKTSNGEQLLTVPILKKGKYDQLINECQINNSEKWQKKHWMTIEHSYKKSPYFYKLKELKELFYDIHYTSFQQLTWDMLLWFNGSLGINTNFILSSSLKTNQHGSNLILEICKGLGATSYLSGGCGKDYMNAQDFHDNKIKIEECHYKSPVYKQLYGEFIPNLSIVDLIANVENPLDIILSGDCREN